MTASRAKIKADIFVHGFITVEFEPRSEARPARRFALVATGKEMG